MELLQLDVNTWNHLTVCNQMISKLFKNKRKVKLATEVESDPKAPFFDSYYTKA